MFSSGWQWQVYGPYHMQAGRRWCYVLFVLPGKASGAVGVAIGAGIASHFLTLSACLSGEAVGGVKRGARPAPHLDAVFSLPARLVWIIGPTA